VTFDRARFEQEVAAARSRRDIADIWAACLRQTAFCLLPCLEREALYEIAADAAKELPHDAENAGRVAIIPGITRSNDHYYKSSDYVR
jgi:hypothetical protein